MTAEKRSVSTDALETLGTIITDGGRDAIHLAVEPVIAAEKLYPGQHVGVVDGKATAKAGKALGIVDPFLSGPAQEGEKFWLVVYPRQITSLRHVWEHPDFGSIDEKIRSADPAKAALERFADEIGSSLSDLLYHAEDYVERGEYWVEGGRFEGQGMPSDFWENYTKVTGKKGPDTEYGHFFSCSC